MDDVQRERDESEGTRAATGSPGEGAAKAFPESSDSDHLKR